MMKPKEPSILKPSRRRSRWQGWGAALLMAATPFLLLGLFILADRLLR